MAGKIRKIATDIGIGIAAKAGKRKVKNAAAKAKNAVVDKFSGPDYSDKRAPHMVIGGMDRIEDYVHTKDDVDFVNHLSKRLEHDLRFILDHGYKEKMQLGDLIDEAMDYKVFGDDENLFLSILEFRVARIKVLNGEEISISLKNRLRWTISVFKLEKGVQDIGDSENTDAAI